MNGSPASSLNPCFVGMWSFRQICRCIMSDMSRVLILVLLGCGLLGKIDFDEEDAAEVLILVLLERRFRSPKCSVRRSR